MRAVGPALHRRAKVGGPVRLVPRAGGLVKPRLRGVVRRNRRYPNLRMRMRMRKMRKKKRKKRKVKRKLRLARVHEVGRTQDHLEGAASDELTELCRRLP